MRTRQVASHGAAVARRTDRRRANTVAALGMMASGVIAIGCHDASTSPTQGGEVRVEAFAVAPNPYNALSALATFGARGADSARVIYWADDATARDTTPATSRVAQGRIAVLGLRATTTYHLAVEAHTGDALVGSDTVSFTTPAAPDFLQHTRLQITGQYSGGYILTVVGNSASAFAVAFDSTGTVAWYREFDEGVPAGETKQQQNGDVTVFLGATHGGELLPGRYVELAPDGRVVRTLTAEPPASTDNHELWLRSTEDAYDGAVMLTYTQRTVDLSAQGGPRDTVISGHQLVRVGVAGNQRVIMDAWDAFTLAHNLDPIPQEMDFDHPNAFDIDADGHYVVSWRDFDAITAIDSTTGAVLWTLGGPHSDFTFVDDPLGGFSAQHGVRVLPSGNLLIFDNGTEHAPAESRAVEYRLDRSAGTATLVWEYRHTPAIYTQYTGSVQRLASGNTLIGWTWGDPLLVTEVTPAGTVAWEGTLESPVSSAPYRFVKIASLYEYQRP